MSATFGSLADMPVQSLLYGDAPLLSLMLGCKNGETESEKRISPSHPELDTKKNLKRSWQIAIIALLRHKGTLVRN